MRLNALLALAVLWSCTGEKTDHAPQGPASIAPDGAVSKPKEPRKAPIAPAEISTEKLPPLEAASVIEPDSFAGANQCKSCHADQYSAWSNSTHGKAGGRASPERIIAPFDGKEIKFADAVVRPVIKGRGYAFEVLEKGRPAARYTVDAVVGGGHIYGGGTQAYFTQLKDGRFGMLPFDYSASANLWFCQNAKNQQWSPIDETVRLRDCEYPPKRVLGIDKTTNCQECHGSQIRLQYSESSKRYKTTWTSLAINCEACHGPGAEHVRTARKGDPSGMEALALRTKTKSVALCSRCHSDKSAVAPGYVTGAEGSAYFATAHLRNPSERRFSIDGLAARFSYQEGHLWSACFRDGSMTCVDCHDPHSGQYRDIFGVALENRFHDGQCTACHPSKGEDSKHSGHLSTQLNCTACHMVLSQHPGVGEKVPYRRADHSISIPRADEPKGHHQANESACTRCHSNKTKEWIAAAWTDLYGTRKPPPPGAELLREVERSLEQPPNVPGIPRMPDLRRFTSTEIFEVVLRVETDHLPLVMRALSALVMTLPKTAEPEVPPEIVLRLGAWAKASDVQLRAAAVAVCLFLAPYEPELSHRALRAMVATSSSEQRAMRRHVVFNLLAILYTVADVSKGASSLAQRAIEEYAVVLADDENPVAAALSAAYSSAGDQRESLAWALRSLKGQNFAKGRYDLDTTGTRADALSRIGHLRREGGSNRDAIDRYSQAVALNPNHQQAREALCVELIKGGRKVEAIECINKYLVIKPDFVQGYFIQARLYEELGKVRKAINAAVKGLKIDPENKVARQNLRRLQGRQ